MRVAGFFVVLALLVAPVSAVRAEEGKRIISVSGQGQVFAEPDMATVRIGVTHEDRQAKAAMDRVAEAVRKVLAQLESAGIAPRDMQTGSLSLNPVWNHRSSSSEPARITGFVANISVTVRVRDLPLLGTVLDAVVSDGANELGGIQFGFQDPEPLMEEARRNAVADGRAKADVLAEAAGVALGPLQTLSEHGGGARPQAMMMEMAARDAAIPIAAGELGLSVSVSMVYAIGE